MAIDASPFRHANIRDCDDARPLLGAGRFINEKWLTVHTHGLPEVVEATRGHAHT
jgi:hypothetical protein